MRVAWSGARLARAYVFETDDAVRRAVVTALAARMKDASAPLRAGTLATAARLDPELSIWRRRIQQNDLENLPFFLVAGLLFVLTEPSLLLARALLYGYVVTRLLHFVAYLTGRTHDTRAMLWTPGSLIIVYMAVRVLWTVFTS